MPRPAAPSPVTRSRVSLRGGTLLALAAAALAPPVLALPAGSPARPAPQVSPAPGWAVMTLDEYRRLREAADPPEAPTAPPPVDLVLSRVDYDLSVQGDTAAGTAQLSAEVLRDGWVALSVPPGLRVSGARLDGRPVALVPDASTAGAKGGGGMQVWMSRRGPARLVMDVVLPILTEAGVERLELPPAPAAVSSTTLTLARAGVDLSVAGGVLTAASATPDAARYVVHARAGEALRFSWQRRRERARPALPLRLRGSVTQFVGLGEDAALVQAVVSVSVTQGQAAGVTLALPEGFTVNEVAGAAVADWSATPGALEVTWLEPLEAAAEFTLSGEVRIPGQGVLDVPLLRLRDAERETGGIALEVLGAGEVTADKPRALDPADAGDLGPPVAGREAPALIAYRYRPQPGSAARALSVDVARYTPQEVLVGNIEEARHRVLLTADGKRLVESTYAVRSRERSFLALALPPGATLWAAAVDARPVRPGLSGTGALLVPLPRGRAQAEAAAVRVSYVERGSGLAREGTLALSLPAVDLPVSRTGLELYVPPEYRLPAPSSGWRESVFAPPTSAALGERALLPPPPAPSAAKAGAEDKDKKNDVEADFQDLLQRFHKEGRAGRVAGVVPLAVPFPSLGRLAFLVAELTPAEAPPSVQMSYERRTR